MNAAKTMLLVGLLTALAGCAIGPDKSIDRGLDEGDLSLMTAGIWVDPVGCHHWIIDDGVEGYLSARLDPYGKPVCPDIGTPTYVMGDFKEGGSSIFGDPF